MFAFLHLFCQYQNMAKEWKLKLKSVQIGVYSVTLMLSGKQALPPCRYLYCHCIIEVITTYWVAHFLLKLLAWV